MKNFTFFLFLFLSFSVIQADAYPHLSRSGAGRQTGEEDKLASQVVIKRTHYGVPHIFADNLKAAGYALGYVQVEDYGKDVVNGLLKARGEWTKYNELSPQRREKAIDADAANKHRYLKAVKTWPRLDRDTRDIMEGFALGVNRYIEKHPDEFEDWVQPFFTAYDVHALDIKGPSRASIHRFISALKKKDGKETHAVASNSLEEEYKSQNGLWASTLWTRLSEKYEEPNPDVGSNAWAFAPDRTTSGNAILLRNPHLYWDAGYYEAQINVPGKFNFYGDFRIGGPLKVIGGFNEHLGWATTNNYPVLNEIYAFKADPDKPDHYLLDGSSVPVKKETITVEFKNGNGLGKENRVLLFTPYGPVIHRGNGRIYIIKSAEVEEFRGGEQFLRMMKAKNLSEWKTATSMQAQTSSNFTYADGDGNIFYVWNGAVPDLPHPWGGDTSAVLVSKSSQIWKNLIPWDSLPHLLNPKGGYLHNENDPFYYTNLNEVFDEKDFPSYFPEPKFRLRSQKSYELIHNENRRFSLEDVVKLKYDEGMLLADRVKDDLVAAVQNTRPSGEIAKAIKMVENWNNTVEKDSRGSVLFKIWWYRYVETADKKSVEPTPASVGFAASPEKLFKAVWSPEKPAKTPYGLAVPERAVKAFEWAIRETKKRYGAWDVKWGTVHRAMAYHKNEPVGGATGLLGCFRVLWYKNTKVDHKNRKRVTGGDGWVLAVEFDKTPKAYSVLAYGNSNKKQSPYYYNQLKMFTDRKMKKVVYTDADIQKQIIKTYRPGEE